ncbi:MAG: anhydro-N-acetylmuramic acid kinase [Gammaproteobacteria bacterium]
MNKIASDIFIGTMSGTSMNGIDVCAIVIKDNKPKLIAFDSYAYPKKISNELFEIIKTPAIHLDNFGRLDAQIGLVFAQAVQRFVNRLRIRSNQVKGIALSGQTVWHAPKSPAPFSLQLGSPHPMAKIFKVPVIFDFRNSHIAAGGEGAPLVPPFHAKMHAFKKPSMVINIGGISNYTVVKSASFFGSDIGPGNALIDTYCRERLNKPYDLNGALASKGSIKIELVQAMLMHKEFKHKHPFSTGKEVFNFKFIPHQILRLRPEDALATLTEVTAQSIAKTVHIHKDCKNIYVCGGGAKNKYLLSRLIELCQKNISTTEEIGIHPQAIESMAFAWMAYMRITNQKIPVAQTGVKSLLGSILQFK